MCVLCAETLVSFKKIAARSPLAGVDVDVKWSGSKWVLVQVGDKRERVERLSNAYAVVTYGTIRYLATSTGTGTAIQFKQEGSQESQYANNVFVLWSMIKNQLLNPKKEETEHRIQEVRNARSQHHYA